MNLSKPFKVVHIDLSETLPNLAALPEKYQGIYAVFWWQGIPLGHKEIDAELLPILAHEIATIAAQTITPTVANQLFKSNSQGLLELQKPLGTLKQQFEKPAHPSVSVIICTRNRSEQLAKCLAALQNLSTPPQEIIVVDNAPSSDATRQLVENTPNVQYVLEASPGLSQARNTGIRQSRGEIIAFTDDDVEVHPDWISHLEQGFCDPNVMAVTGLVMPAQLETEAQLIFEKVFEYFHRGYSPITFDQSFFERTKNQGVPVWEIGAGANMAFRRQAFEKVDYFDERLGAGASGCSEDSEFWYRLLAEGWECRYEPSAVVFHHHRGDVAQLKQQMYYYMRGHASALLVQFAKYKHWGNLYRLFFVLPLYYLRLFVSGIIRGFKPRQIALFEESLGLFSGIFLSINTILSPSYTPKS
jgi:GT2 family glycosyltransferase